MEATISRDLVWDAVIEALIEADGEPIQKRHVREILDERVEDRTINRTMNAMQELEWLERTTDRAHKWYPGPKALAQLSAL